jgi:transposase-like protein
MANTTSQKSKPKTKPCPKNEYQKVSFDLKLIIIDRISNGQISLRHAAEVYNISRSSISYWMKKLSNFTQTKKSMSKNDEIKKLREKIEELEFIKGFQQDCIVDFERITGQELSKKYLPEALANEIARKKKKLTK